jgi:hypothetical protein
MNGRKDTYNKGVPVFEVDLPYLAELVEAGMKVVQVNVAAKVADV